MTNIDPRQGINYVLMLFLPPRLQRVALAVENRKYCPCSDSAGKLAGTPPTGLFWHTGVMQQFHLSLCYWFVAGKVESMRKRYFPQRI